jgi:hypothetical protein
MGGCIGCFVLFLDFIKRFNNLRSNCAAVGARADAAGYVKPLNALIELRIP